MIKWEIIMGTGDDSIKIIGRKDMGKKGIESADGFLQMITRLRVNKPYIPKGVHKFTSFEESNLWSMKMMARQRNPAHRR